MAYEADRRLAVVSDIHGNLPALEAVIADLRAAGADAVVNLGDIVSGPLWPAETARLLMSLRWSTLRGNHERYVLSPPGTMGPSDSFAAAQLDARQRKWLAALPSSLWLAPDLFCCHGTPDYDTDYFLETVTGGWVPGGDESGVRPASEAEVAERLGDIRASLTLCGHTHCARITRLPDGRCVMNPGSVGLPAYDDDVPLPHVIEAGSPHARYALAERRDDGWQLTLRQVAYDWRAAARRAEANGRGDWADALRSGRVGRPEREVVHA